MPGFLDRFGRPHSVIMVQISKAKHEELLATAKIDPEFYGSRSFMVCVEANPLESKKKAIIYISFKQ